MLTTRDRLGGGGCRSRIPRVTSRRHPVSLTWRERSPPYKGSPPPSSRHGSPHRESPTRPGTAAAARPRDRKSTRLNSSHSQISYAVFCLKKKKIYIIGYVH